MTRQASFADLEYASKKRQTRRELFLNEMEEVVPWVALLARLEPHYPKSGRRGRQPMELKSMLRIYCAQHWFNFSDRQMEDALYEIESLRRFCGFSGVTEALPDETTILNFRHFLEKHDLTAKLQILAFPCKNSLFFNLFSSHDHYPNLPRPPGHQTPFCLPDFTKKHFLTSFATDKTNLGKSDRTCVRFS